MNIVGSLEKQSQSSLIVEALAIVAVVGVVDYLTSPAVLFSTLYLVAVALAAWFVGKWFGVAISILSVAVWLAGDVAAGAPFSNPLVLTWNATIVLTFYLVIVWLLTSLRSLHKELEDRVRRRTVALTEEMAGKQRLEKEILEISERERRAIGRDLHDSLGQHLTATALAGQVLEEKLSAKSLAEATDARRVVDLIENAVELTRSLARGLHPLEITAAGFQTGLDELAAAVSDSFKVTCQFECNQSVPIDDGATATHLYRIAQEAVTNAVKHGQARHILIRLSRSGTGTHLMVIDDGVGLPEPLPQSNGLGLRIMAHRASILGGKFAVARGAAGGTVVTCVMP
jgi:signal transduction histidine kinase